MSQKSGERVRSHSIWGLVARSGLWTIAGCVVGTLVAAFFVVSVSAFSSSHSLREFAGRWLGEYLLAVLTGLFAALFYGAPSYLPLLLLWPFVAQRFPRLECEPSRFVAAMFVLALPAAFVCFAMSGQGKSLRIASSWRDDIQFALSCFFVAWPGLVVPRFWLRHLRLGVFVGRT